MLSHIRARLMLSSIYILANIFCDIKASFFTEYIKEKSGMTGFYNSFSLTIKKFNEVVVMCPRK